jgi:hypothetical protein
MVPAALSAVERLVEAGGVPPVLPGWGLVGSERGLTSGTGYRGVWPWANRGVHPKSGNRPPYPLIRNCWTMEKMVVVIQ